MKKNGQVASDHDRDDESMNETEEWPESHSASRQPSWLMPPYTEVDGANGLVKQCRLPGNLPSFTPSSRENLRAGGVHVHACAPSGMYLAQTRSSIVAQKTCTHDILQRPIIERGITRSEVRNGSGLGSERDEERQRGPRT